MSRWYPARAVAKRTSPDVTTAPRVLFLDRDGVVIEDRHYVRDPGQVRLIPGAAAAMRRARAAGYFLIGVSNQSGIGRGLYSLADFQAVHERVDALLARDGADFDAFFYCPHGPEVDCHCRKPRPGLLQEAREVVPWQAANSWLVGDKLADMELALSQGLGAILVTTGQGCEERQRLPAGWPVRVVDDLEAAVSVILAGEPA